jgi:hypothetical protein
VAEYCLGATRCVIGAIGQLHSPCAMTLNVSSERYKLRRKAGKFIE